MRYLFILMLLFVGCGKQSTSAVTECVCWEDEGTATEFCEFYTSGVSCLEDCFEEDVDDLTPEETEAYEDLVEVCTDCLEDEECEIYLYDYMGCINCLDACEDNLIESFNTLEECTDYCEATDACVSYSANQN
jgi:hypothetical protein